MLTEDELESMRLRLRRFIDEEIIPLEPPTVDGASLPPAELEPLRARARELGFWALGVSPEYGGKGLSTYELVVLATEIYRTTVTGTYLGAGLFGETAPNLLMFAGTPDQREQYLRPIIEQGRHYFFAWGEPAGGSDPSAMTTTAMKSGPTWVLNGRKGLISNVDGADYGFVFARTDDGGKAGFSCFIVDADNPGFSFTPAPTAINGQRVSYIDLKDCVVPEHDILGKVGDGLRLGQKWLGQMRTIYYGAAALGMATRSIELATAHAKSRSTFGELLANRQSVQFALADSAMELRLGQLLVHDTARQLDSGDFARQQVAMVKIMGTESAARIVDRCMQILGGLGLTSAYPLEQFLRTLRVWRITEGANEIHRWFIAREMLA